MISRRRLTLQLTPLLDMLLIVVFLQYFQLRDREHAVTQDQESIVEERAVSARQVRELSNQLEDLQQKLALTQIESLKAMDSVDQLKENSSRSESQLSRVTAQQQAIGQLLQELFQIPAEEVARLIDASRAPGASQTPQEQELQKQRFQKIAEQTPGRILTHLLSYDEIRKRCDIWNVHIDDQGVVTLTDGQRPARIRIPLTEDGELISEQFVSELFAWYRTLAQPKSLVVVLLSYDRDSRIYLTEAVRGALPVWTMQMQTDSDGRSRFEYADLGFRIE